MRHGKKFNHLGRQTAHRSAMLSNMASSLIIHKRINTTVAKAKALRKYIDPLLTKSKTDNTHSRRVVFSYLQDKESVTELFSSVAEKIAARPGGYTRIIKTGARLGDNAEMCMMELVDFNELLLADDGDGKAKTRRSRRGGSKPKADATATEVAEVEEVAVEVEASEEVVEETTAEAETVKEVVAEETPVAEVEETPAAEPDESTPEASDKPEDSEEEKKD